jgi:hypothetical protein
MLFEIEYTEKMDLAQELWLSLSTSHRFGTLGFFTQSLGTGGNISAGLQKIWNIAQ